MKLYVYEGPVLSNGKVVHYNWKGQTYAKTCKKAISNLCYRYKIEKGFLPTCNISLYLKPKETQV